MTPFLTPRAFLAWTAGIGLAAAVGCACRPTCPDGCEPGPRFGRGGRFPNLCVDNCSDIPAGAIPPPNGSHTLNYLHRQADKAESDDFAIYYNEWKDDTAEFGPFGTAHIEQIARRLPSVAFPVVIQPVEDRELNAARKAAVIDVLTRAKIDNAKDRVIVAYPTGEGLFGEEAERIYPQLILGGGLGGGGLGGGGLGGGGLGGGGFGGGGFGGGGFGGGGFGGGGFGGGGFR